MITIFVGVGALALIALIVGIVDAAQAPTRRLVAAQRREHWEARQLEFHGVESDSNWDDD